MISSSFKVGCATRSEIDRTSRITCGFACYGPRPILRGSKPLYLQGCRGHGGRILWTGKGQHEHPLDGTHKGGEVVPWPRPSDIAFEKAKCLRWHSGFGSSAVLSSSLQKEKLQGHKTPHRCGFYGFIYERGISKLSEVDLRDHLRNKSHLHGVPTQSAALLIVNSS